MSDAINGFVREINRRYGVIKADDMNKYWEMVREDRKYTATGTLNTTDYSILPGEDDYETDRRAPSDRYMRGTAGTDASTITPKFELDISDWTDRAEAPNHYKRLREFRQRLEKQFAEVPSAQYERTSYGVYIQQTALEIKRASTKEAKLALAMKLIQGSTSAGMDSNKAFMFHETVVVGLNVLSAIQSLLYRFSTRLENLDFERASEEIRASLIAGTAAIIAVDNHDQLAARVGDNYLDTGHTGRRAGVGAYILGDGANVLLRAGADGAMTFDNVATFLREEVNTISGLGGMPAAYQPLTTQGAITAFAAANTIAAMRFESALNLGLRMVFDYNRAMRDLIENIFDLVGNGQGLIGVRFPGTSDLQLQFDFSKLSNFCSTLMSDVRFFMDQLRPFLDATIISRFKNGDNVGSVFWLEKNLMDRFFRGTVFSRPTRS